MYIASVYSLYYSKKKWPKTYALQNIINLKIILEGIKNRVFQRKKIHNFVKSEGIKSS